MPRAFKLLSKSFSRLEIFNQYFWSSKESTRKYQRLSQPTASGGEIEDGLGEDQIPKKNRFCSKYLLISCLIVGITLIVWYSLTDHTPIRKAPVPPLRIFYKVFTTDKVDCDPPVTIVTNEDDAQVVIWPNPGYDISSFDGQKARKEKPWQLNAFWSLENEEYYVALRDARVNLESGDPKAFDLGITYRTQTDFPIPYTYSFIDLRKESLKFEERRQDKLIAAFISNCNPQNNRTAVLDELMKLLPGQVDSFGGCRNNADPHEVVDRFNWNPSNGTEPAKPLDGWSQKMRIISHYKFTIAFENADEPDYVTEKYYQALSAGSIPIQLGQTTEDFKKFKPSPNCALNVADFKNLEELSHRIKAIGRDRNTFQSMLEWKTKPFSKSFEHLVSWGKDHEACRLAKWAQNEWQNPFLNDTRRYESLRERLKLSPPNITSTNSSDPLAIGFLPTQTK